MEKRQTRINDVKDIFNYISRHKCKVMTMCCLHDFFLLYYFLSQKYRPAILVCKILYSEDSTSIKKLLLTENIDELQIHPRLYNAKPSVYYFYVKMKVLVDFHICFSKTLNKLIKVTYVIKK